MILACFSETAVSMQRVSPTKDASSFVAMKKASLPCRVCITSHDYFALSYIGIDRLLLEFLFRVSPRGQCLIGPQYLLKLKDRFSLNLGIDVPFAGILLPLK